IGAFRKHESSAVHLGTSGLAEVEPSKIIEVASTALADDFDRNPGKYKDKSVLVTGEVLEVKADGAGAKLKSAGPKTDTAEFNDLANHAAAKLMAGKTAVLRAESIFGDGDGGVTLLDIVVAEVKDKEKDKTENKVPVTPWAAVSAEDIAKEFSRDEAAGLAKYKDKIIQVHGDVDSVGPIKTLVYLKGARKSPLDKGELLLLLQIKLDSVAKSVRLSKGQRIQAVGKFLQSDGNSHTLTIGECTVTELEGSNILVAKTEDLAQAFEMDL